jgi:hypothetical protein
MVSSSRSSSSTSRSSSMPVQRSMKRPSCMRRPAVDVFNYAACHCWV